LVASHADVRGIILGFGCIVGVDVDHLDDPIGVSPRRRDIELGLDRPSDRQVIRERFARIDKDIRSRGGEPLVFDEIVPVVSSGGLHGIGHRFGGIADILVEAGVRGIPHRSEGQPAVVCEEQRLLFRVRRRPNLVVPPLVGAGLEYDRFGKIQRPFPF